MRPLILLLSLVLGCASALLPSDPFSFTTAEMQGDAARAEIAQGEIMATADHHFSFGLRTGSQEAPTSTSARDLDDRKQERHLLVARIADIEALKQFQLHQVNALGRWVHPSPRASRGVILFVHLLRI